MISRAEILMGRDKDYPLTPEMERNLDKLLAALNKFRALYGKPMIVTSGYRPRPYNDVAHGAKNSPHLTCEACDFADKDGKLDAWCMIHQDILVSCGLYLESPMNTVGWCHLQTRPTKNRVFSP